MSVETELQRRLEAAAARLEPDPSVLDVAEFRAHRQLTIQRTVRVLAVAAVLVLAGVVALLVGADDEMRNPIVDSPPVEVEDEPAAPDPEVRPDPEPQQREDPEEQPVIEDPVADPAGVWSELPAAPLAPRSGAAATWIGDRVFIWGGRLTTGAPAPAATDGALYDPDEGRWEKVADAPAGLIDATAVWTGDEVLVFGSPTVEFAATPSHTLLAYDPANDRWRTDDVPAIEPRLRYSLSWTGAELIVWGGASLGAADEQGIPGLRMHGDGAAFDPGTRTWRVLPEAPIAPRGDHGAVWDGERLVVFGGGAADFVEGEFAWHDYPDDAAAYDPAADRWSVEESPPTAGPLVGAHWTGEAIVYWTGHVHPDTPNSWLEAGGTWGPATSELAGMSPPPFDGRRDNTPTVWAPDLGRLLTWGGAIGEGGNHLWHTGASYDPATDVWTVMADSPLGARTGHVAVWTGSELIVWGGVTDGYERALTEDDWAPEFSLRDDGASWHLERS